MPVAAEKPSAVMKLSETFPLPADETCTFAGEAAESSQQQMRG